MSTENSFRINATNFKNWKKKEIFKGNLKESLSFDIYLVYKNISILFSLQF